MALRKVHRVLHNSCLYLTNCLHDWAVLWGLSFNFKKYEVLKSVLLSYLLLTDPTLSMAIHLL